MRLSDIPCGQPDLRELHCLGELVARADSAGSASWTDLPKRSGVYIVSWPLEEQPSFRPNTGDAYYAVPADRYALQMKWERIHAHYPTDILYIGKADSIKSRVRLLARFGAGRARSHHGGEWMWQIDGIGNALLTVQSCPPGMHHGFENWLLERFHHEHGDYPLANRVGPRGDERWHAVL